jgi:hypothetical protein
VRLEDGTRHEEVTGFTSNEVKKYLESLKTTEFENWNDFKDQLIGQLKELHPSGPYDFCRFKKVKKPE